MEDYVEIVTSYVNNYAHKIIFALLILFIGKWISKRIARLFSKALEKTKTDITLVKFLRNIIYYILYVLVLMAAANEVGINTASFLTIIGAAGLAIGFALKDSLSNFASGVMIIIFKPFKVNDVIDSDGTIGKVIEISIFNTVLFTADNKKIIVPNSSLTGTVVTNVSANDTRRVDLVIGIGYDDDIKTAKECLNSILESDNRVLDEPESKVAVSELGDSSVNFVVRPWMKSEDYWDVYFDLTEKIKLEFDAKGISFPFPQQDVHLYKNN